MDHARAWVEIDLGAFRQNLANARAMLPPATKLFVVVKADAYGCGAAEIARCAERNGADALAVGCLSDLAAIRDVGVSLPALLYPSTVPSQLGAVLATGAICTIHDDLALDVISVAGTAVRAFVKVDCGFGRLGFVPSSWTSIFERIAATPAI